MISRVTENMKFNTTVGNIFTIQNKSENLLEQLATQKKINRPSDDPRGTTNVLSLRSVSASLDQYKDNIATGQNWLNYTEVNLNGVNDLLKQAREAAIQSGGIDSTTAANLVQSITDQVVDLANAKFGDQYIFSGTKSNIRPFTVNGTPPPPYTYHGDNELLKTNIGQNSSTEYNVTGAEVFTAANGGVDIFQTLTDLKAALLAGTDTSQILANLETANSQVQIGIAQTATMLNRLEFANNHLTDLSMRIGDMIYNAESADIAQLAAQLNMNQVALNASYSVAAKIGENTILNFLK